MPTNPALLLRATQQVIDLLNSSNLFYMADLYQITTIYGQVYRYTNLDIDLPGMSFSIPGTTITITNALFQSLLIERGDLIVSKGLDASDLTIDIYPRDTDMAGSADTLLQAVTKGTFDAASVLVFRAFFSAMPGPATFVGAILEFAGNLSEIDQFSRTHIPLSAKSALELLNGSMPRNVYQPSCRNTLYQLPCGAVKVGYSSSVLVGSTQNMINCGLTEPGSTIVTVIGGAVATSDGTSTTYQLGTSEMTIIGRPTVYLNGKVTLEWSLDSNNMITFNLVLSNGISHPAPQLGVVITADYSYVQAGIFDMGTCTFTSGANNGISRTVASSLTGVLNFAMPLPNVPAPGDTFTVYPGCDRSTATCHSKFNALAYYNAEPYIPQPESVY